MAAITKVQVDAVVNTLQNCHKPFGQLEQFALSIQRLMANNWVDTINIGGNIGGSTIAVSAAVSPTDQATLLAQYTALKTNITTLINQLP